MFHEYLGAQDLHIYTYKCIVVYFPFIIVEGSSQFVFLPEVMLTNAQKQSSILLAAHIWTPTEIKKKQPIHLGE